MKKAFALSIVLILAFSLSFTARAQPVFPRSLIFTVYEDGAVFVDYELDVDPTYPSVNVTLFGYTFENLMVVDGEGLPLTFSLSNNTVTVNTLGSSTVRISYTTLDLTSKFGRYWSFNVSVPVTSVIVLPERASIISLNKVPDSIESRGGKTVVTMPSGDIEITYVVGIVGTKEHAQVVLNDVEEVIGEIKSLGVIVSDAEDLLLKAKDAFNNGNYVLAEDLASQAKDLAVQINQTAFQAKEAIDEADRAIAEAEEEGREVGLSEAKDLLNQAKESYGKGNYQSALNLATQAKDLAEGAKPSAKFPYIWILALVIVVALVGLIAYKAKGKGAYEKEAREVDLGKIFKEKPYLKLEDKEVLRFLAESGGEAFESEIRERFQLPRTTTWRLIKRLEKEGIIEVRKVGGQNLVKIRSDFVK